jgi:Putative Flp pilus-assembly TadE/G-like
MLGRGNIRSERGAVVVMMAVMLVPIALLLAFAIETGWWWTHHRHLQTQADAAVFAGADGPWLPGCNDNPSDPSSIVGKALVYSGDENRSPSPPVYNLQYSNATNVHALINSTDYWDKGGVDNSDGGSPCATLFANNGHLDVKMTEAGLPTFFGTIPGFTSVDVHTHARVEIQQLASASGALPISLPDPNPVAGEAYFVDESAGTSPPPIIARAPLTKNPINPALLNGQYLTEWDAGAVSVPINDPKTGVVIAFSGRTNWDPDTGDLTTICNQTLIECYQGEDSGTYTGLWFIHGYSNSSGSPDKPALGDFSLKNVTCGDDSAPSFVLNGDCTVSASATIDFGTATNIKVALDAPGCPTGGNPKGCPMTSDGSGRYTTMSNLPTIPSSAGPQPFTINWSDRDPLLKKNYSGSFTDQRVYSANNDPAFSGPIEYVKVTDSSTGNAASSVLFGNPSLRVSVGIQSNVGTQSGVNDPPVKLRVIGGSRNQSLDCDPNPPIAPDDPGYNNLWQELAYGCWPQYAPNTGQPCPKSASALWSTGVAAFPWTCVAVQTGSATNQVPKGLNLRILGDETPSTCPALGQLGHNNWKYDPDGDGIPDIPDGDPRALFIFMTPFGTFTGNGSGTVPVTGFAEFYITGWTGQGQGFDNPCQGQGDDTAPGPATIVGHFMKYVPALTGRGTGRSCVVTDPSILTPCLAVLTQ